MMCDTLRTQRNEKRKSQKGSKETKMKWSHERVIREKEREGGGRGGTYQDLGVLPWWLQNLVNYLLSCLFNENISSVFTITVSRGVESNFQQGLKIIRIR